MSSKHPVLSAVLFASAIFSSNLLAAEFRGTTPSGARYLIKTPDAWQPGGKLVIVNHGYDLQMERSDPSLGPSALRDYLLGRGYAIAASGYSTGGWATFTARADTEELMQKVLATIGRPGKVFTSGGSLGGLISLQQAELAASGTLPSLPQVDGVLSLCPPLAGSRVWDKAIDFRVSYDQICADSTPLPSGPDTAPWLLDADDVDNGGSSSALAQVALSASRCVGYELSENLQSSGMRSRRAKLLAATQSDEAFMGQLLFYATFGLSDIIYDSRKLGGLPAQPFDTRGINYLDASLNDGVRRLQADPLSRLRLESAYTPTGRIGNAKLLTITTSRDGLVVPQHLRFLENRVNPAQWQRALVQESSPSHCGFSDAELVQSFKRLEAWTDGSAKPSIAELNQDCAGCRFAGAENLPELDAVMPPRQTFVVESGIDAGVNGDWYSKSRSGEGIKVEALLDGRALVNFFTYPKTGDDAAQLWLTGVGRYSASGIVVDDVYQTSGPRFGAAFSSSDVRLQRWGSFQFAQRECGKAVFTYNSATHGTASIEMTQLTRQQVPCFSRQALKGYTGFSGSWYDRTRSGEGVQLTVQNDETMALAWYTYTPEGKQAWMVLQAPYLDLQTRGESEGTLYLPTGTRFGNDFNPANVRVSPFGNGKIRFLNCSSAEFTANTPWGTQRLNLQRLTLPLGAENCPGGLP